MPGPERGLAASCFSLELVFPTQSPHSRRAGRAAWGPGHLDVQEGGGCPATPLKIPQITGILLLSPMLSLTPASSSFPPSVEREHLLLQHSTTVGSLTIIPHPQHLPRAPGAQSLQFPVWLKPQLSPPCWSTAFMSGQRNPQSLRAGCRSRWLLPGWVCRQAAAAAPGSASPSRPRSAFT